MSNDDSITLGGIPAASLEARRAKRESGGALTDRPTQPILHALGEMPDGSPAPDVPPPDRQRALDLARAYRSGGEAQRVVGRDGCAEMARWIETRPDYVAVIDRVVGAELVAQRIVTGPHVQGDLSLREALDELADAKARLATLGSSLSPSGDMVGALQGLVDEWLLATVAVERARARGDMPSDEALERMDNAERAVAEASSLDRRFSGWLSGVMQALRNRRQSREAQPHAVVAAALATVAYLRLRLELHAVPNESSEADGIRDRMDDHWNKMDNEGRELARLISAALNEAQSALARAHPASYAEPAP